MSKSGIDSRDNREIVIAELEKLGGWQKTANEYQMVCCPFHPDRTPSCGVYISFNQPDRIGNFNCLGCGEHGTWAVFAERTGLQKIKEWKNKNVHNANLVDAAVEENLLGSASLTPKGVLALMGVPESQPWPTNMDWRGFPGSIVRKAGGYIAQDHYNNSVQVVFIVKYAGQVRGGVKAMFEKARKGQTSYVTMRGPWVSKYGLLFFDVARSIMEKTGYTFLILVEGPRDALRLLSNGIPAVAVLGAATMSKSKAMMVTSLGPDRVYVMPDNDIGGDTFWEGAKKMVRPRVPTTLISLPREFDKQGKIIKIDPGNMSLDLLNDLITMLERKQEFKRRKVLI